MAVVTVSFHYCVFNRSVHQLDLAIGPGMVWLGQAVLDPICLADHIGLVTVTFRSLNSVKRPFVRMPTDWFHLTSSSVVVDYKTH